MRCFVKNTALYIGVKFLWVNSMMNATVTDILYHLGDVFQLQDCNS